MNRKYSLKSSQDISCLVKKRQSVGNKYYAIYYNKKKEDIPQIAFAVSKKNGIAVIRNYEKRVTKEIFREKINEFIGYELLIVIKATIIELTFEEKKEQLYRLLKKIKGETNE